MSTATCTKCGKTWKIENAEDFFLMAEEMILKEPDEISLRKDAYKSLPMMHKIDMGKLKSSEEIKVIIEK